MTAESQMRAGIYVRISETVEKIDKVGNQEADCRNLASDEGYLVVEVYTDDGISASTFRDRPGWSQMLHDVQESKLDVILAVDQDRFSRQPMEKETLQLLCATHGVVWHTVRGNGAGVIDPATADGEFLSSLYGILARHEVRKKSERQRAGNRHRVAQGLPLSGNRPFGFEVDRIRHREDESEQIRWAYSVLLDGGSLYSIRKAWNEGKVFPSRLADGLARYERMAEPDPSDTRAIVTRDDLRARNEKGLRVGWSHQSLKQLLQRPRNAGLVTQTIRTDGSKKVRRHEIIEGVQAAWTPIVSREVFDAVGAILRNPDRRTSSATGDGRWLMSGLAACGTCGGALRAATGSSNGGLYSIYRCETQRTPGLVDKRPHPAIKAGILDTKVAAGVAAAFLRMPPNAASSPAVQLDLEQLREKRTHLAQVLQAQRDITEAIGTPGFSLAAAKHRAGQLAAEEASVRIQLDEHARQSAHVAMLTDAKQELFDLWSQTGTNKLTPYADLLGTPTGKRIDLDDAVTIRSALIEKFNSLPLRQRRSLVKAMLTVTVNPGRSPDRVFVTVNGGHDDAFEDR